MSVYLFAALCYLLLFLLLSNTLCVQTLVDGQAPIAAKNPVKLFNEKQISDAKQPDGNLKELAKAVTVKNYYSPVLVSTNNFFFALAGVERTGEPKKRNIDILTKYIESAKLLTSGDWTSQFAVQHEEEEKSSDNIYFVRGLLAVATEEKVFLLLLNSSTKTEPTSPEWEFKFAVATINNEPARQIVWNEELINAESVIGELKEIFRGEKATSFSFSGSAFLLEEKKIVFALVVENSGKKVFALMQFNYIKKKIEFETGFAYTEIVKDCYPYVFPWGKKIIMILGKCSTDNEKKTMELTEVSKEWKVSTEAFSRQWKFLKDKKHFTTTKIAGESVLLFTEERTKGDGQKEVNFWMSDGNRYIKVESITTFQSEETFFASILPTKTGLFALYQKCKIDETSPGTINKVCFINLKTHLEKITDTITAWNTSNNQIKELYKDTANGKYLCSTDGLVGFLTGTEGADKWKDKYHNVDATFYGEGAKKQTVGNGLTFTGQGAGARWIVGEQKDNQPYNLKYSGFTLVATVTIGSSKKIEAENSILGVVLSGDSLKGVGLWCTKDGEWGINTGDGQPETQPSAVNCTPERTYYVAVILENNSKLSVYVNGQKLKKEGIDITSESVKHFYFGVDEGKTNNTDVTITDVLLYNLPFEEKKINELRPKETIVADAQQTTGGDNTDPLNDDKNKTGNDSLPKTSPTINENEKTQSSSPPPTTEDSAVRVGVVGVLSLFIGVFTLLGRYVY